MTYNQTLLAARSLDAPRKLWYPSTARFSRRRNQSQRVPMAQPKLHDAVWAQLCALSPCGMVLLDGHAVIQFINPSAAVLLGADADQAVGQRLMELVPRWKDTTFYASLPSLLNAQSTFEAIDFDVPGPEGKHLRVCGACVP